MLVLVVYGTVRFPHSLSPVVQVSCTVLVKNACVFQGPAAKEYKFILDPFQQEALLCLDNNQSVLVSAHTSAGKTVVAE